MKNEGWNSYRKNDPLHQSELTFAQEWEKINNNGHVLEYILGSHNERHNNLTDRDIQVAATVIQWLGSNVGQSFLETVNIKLISKVQKNGQDFTR